jgi:hypothetical protein
MIVRAMRYLFTAFAAVCMVSSIVVVVLLWVGWCDWPPHTLWSKHSYSVIVAQNAVTVSNRDSGRLTLCWSTAIWIGFIAGALAIPPFIWCWVMLELRRCRNARGFPVQAIEKCQ